MLSGRWHSWHFCWKIGATSRENVTSGCAAAGAAYDSPTASNPAPMTGNRPPPAPRCPHPPLLSALIMRPFRIVRRYRPDGCTVTRR